MTDFTSLARPLLPAQIAEPTVNRPASGDPNFDLKAREQANEFEASFLSALLRPVFEGLAKDNQFGGGFAEETWTGLLTDEYAKGIQSSANLGIADHVYDQLVQLQEQSTARETSAPPSDSKE